MKITIIFPRYPFSERSPVLPPILEYLAALTLQADPSAEVELIDANKTPVNPAELNTDLVAVSTMTVTAPWAYRFADECRLRGLRVVMGGIHPTILPGEAAGHANAVVIGEAESVWPELLADAKAGKLKGIYRGRKMPLDGIPVPYDSDLKRDYRFRAFFTMRGCPYSCRFCSVPGVYGKSIRCRPVHEVAAEIESRAGKIWFNGDDNIWGGDIKRNLQLFEELAQVPKKHWYGFGDLKTVQGNDGDRLLAAAGRSGLFSVMAGWESNSEAGLRHFGAAGKQGTARVEAIKRIQSHGIYVVLFIVVGGRYDDIESFKRTLEIADSLNVGIHPILLMPLPGTELFDVYRDYLLPGQGWEHYTGINAVFEHPDPKMTVFRREEEYHRLRRELYSLRRVVKRISRIPLKGFPATHFLSFMKEIGMHLEMKKAHHAWQKKSLHM